MAKQKGPGGKPSKVFKHKSGGGRDNNPPKNPPKPKK